MTLDGSASEGGRTATGLTPGSLDAIRARDADWHDPKYERPTKAAFWEFEAATDRRDLLALLDAERAEMERLRALSPWTNSNHVQHDIAVEEGRLIERARIAEVVRGLPRYSPDLDGTVLFGKRRPSVHTDVDGSFVDRAAVLAAIEGADR